MHVHRIIKWLEELGSVEDKWHAKLVFGGLRKRGASETCSN